MPTARNLRRSVLVLACVSGLLAVLFVGLRLRGSIPPVAKPASKEGNAVEPTIQEPEIRYEDRGRLEPETPVEAEIKGFEGHRYEFTLKAGELGHLVVEQKGIDVVARFVRPDGKAGRVDNPFGSDGPEIVYEVAESSGTYQLEVFCEVAESSGRYEIRWSTPRLATDRDRQHFAAWRAFREGEKKRREDQHREALGKYQEALSLWSELNDDWWRAEALYRVGWMHQELQEVRKALSVQQEARPLFHAQARRIPEGMAVNRIARLHYLLSEDLASLEASQKAVEISRQMQAPDLEAFALHNLGNAHVVLGQIQPAQEAYQATLERARESGNRWAEGAALFGLGDILIIQGRTEDSLDLLQRSLEIMRDLQEAEDEAEILKRIANAHQRLENRLAARAHLEDALRVFRSTGNLRAQGTVLNSLGTIDLLDGRNDAAEGHYRQALALFRQVGNVHGEAFALHNLARHAYAIGDDRQAASLHDQASGQFRKMENLPGEVSARFGSARALHRQGEHAAANERLQWVVSNLEVLRNESDSINLRTGYLTTKQHYYDLQVDVLMSLHEQQPGAGFAVNALEVHERRRARGLLDLLSLVGVKGRKGSVDPALGEREGTLQSTINALDLKLMEQPSEQRAAELERRQREALLELERVRTEMRRQSSRASEEAKLEPLTLRQMQENVLGDRSILLVYALGEERSFLWLVPHQGEITGHVLPARSWIEANARQAQQALSARGQRRRDDRWLAELSKVLLQPVADRLNDKRLVIVADGALESLPFAALPDPRQTERVPLIAKHEVVVLPSASVLATLRRDLHDRLPATLRIAVVADPVFGKSDPRLAGAGGGIGQEGRSETASGELQRSARDLGIDWFDPLPFTREEAEMIRGFVSEEQRFEALGFEASRETVLSGRLKRYRVLHFATHGLLNPKHPELSGLVLSLLDKEGHPQDGFLRAYEIASLDLPAELAVLSACQTGRGQDVRGEGVVGLTRSFMDAGVPRVIVSLWNVDDRGTAELMQRFYHGLFKERLRPAEALRCAQLSMIDDERWSDPYYWAPFIFQGEWRLEVRADGDDGIETRVGGGGLGGRSDDDLPPPIQGLAERAGCPKLD